ncbi:MAG: type III pantothenate kinase [Thermoflexibacter sp.]|jgi:type III pantothenate kinase|nr:type III pantothenate kinase [Thermoflexibacter sp.]
MLLAIDIGNSNIVFGIYKESNWVYVWRAVTSVQKNAIDYEVVLRNYFLESDLKISEIHKVVLSSVVPPLTEVLRQTVVRFCDKEPILVNADTYPQLKIAINNPHEIGSDLVCNAIAASHRFPDSHCIIVDFGTALTFTTVSKHREILGVAITLGLQTAIRALAQHTAKLPEVPLELPQSAIGKNTTHAIQAGVLFGYVGLVPFMLQQIENELGEKCKIVATGGLSSILTSLQSYFDQTDMLLTLDGLRLIGESIDVF